MNAKIVHKLKRRQYRSLSKQQINNNKSLQREDNKCCIFFSHLKDKQTDRLCCLSGGKMPRRTQNCKKQKNKNTDSLPWWVLLLAPWWSLSYINMTKHFDFSCIFFIHELFHKASRSCNTVSLLKSRGNNLPQSLITAFSYCPFSYLHPLVLPPPVNTMSLCCVVSEAMCLSGSWLLFLSSTRQPDTPFPRWEQDFIRSGHESWQTKYLPALIRARQATLEICSHGLLQ